MSDTITNVGKEYIFDEEQDGDTLTMLLYDQSTDELTQSDDLGDITTEPDDSETYERQDTLISTTAVNSEYGFENDDEVEFDVSTNDETVDFGGYIAEFESSVAGDTEPEEHLIAFGELTETRDLSEFDTLTFVPGDIMLVGRNPSDD